MIIALIDNGSLEPAAHRNLRAVAAALSTRTGVPVEAVSWRHSDRVPAAALDGAPAWTVASWLRARTAEGTRDFLFVPFFISAQGAIGSALRMDLDSLAAQLGGFSFTFTEGLETRGALTSIVAIRIRETAAAAKLSQPSVIIVDHGGPSPASAALRDLIAAEVRTLLGAGIRAIAAASMEGAHGPLFADVLATPGFDRGHVVIVPLFLSPGRHAGPDGDLAQIARGAAARVHFTDLVGTHPAALATLGLALRDALASPATPTSA